VNTKYELKKVMKISISCSQNNYHKLTYLGNHLHDIHRFICMRVSNVSDPTVSAPDFYFDVAVDLSDRPQPNPNQDISTTSPFPSPTILFHFWSASIMMDPNSIPSNDEPNPLAKPGLRLLSLDGGGIRGLSSLYILQNLLQRLNSDRQNSNLPSLKPCELFDLIGGTSTGG
jgi:hypothetical protein